GFRSPVLLAREMAMIDYLSGGRMLPAVGIGVEQEGEFRAAGVPFKERGRRTDEAIAIMRRCWAEETVTFSGEFWQLERISVLPRPVQQPFPLWIGGSSEAAMRRAGRLGDGWIPSFITPERFRGGVEKRQRRRSGAGREAPRRSLRSARLLLLRARPRHGARHRRPVHPTRPGRRRDARAVHGVRASRDPHRAARRIRARGRLQ